MKRRQGGPVIAVIGKDQAYVPGDDIAYRFERPKPFPSGMAATLPAFATGRPQIVVDGKWVDLPLNSRYWPQYIFQWHQDITVIYDEVLFRESAAEALALARMQKVCELTAK